MAEISGIGGTVALTPSASTYLHVTSWSGTIEQDTVAIPPTMNADPATEGAAGGALRFRGSLTGKLDDTYAPIDPAANSNFTAAVVLSITATHTLSGNVMVSNVGINRRLADADCTIDIRNYGTSGMAFTWV